MIKKAIKIPLIALFWIGLWQVVALLAGNALLFPSPFDVIVRLGQLIVTENFVLSVLASLARVTIGIVTATVLGVLLAILCARFNVIYELIYPMITVIKATPVASFIVLVLLFIGSDVVPTFITVLMVLPIVWTNVYKGIKCISNELSEVCKVYSIPFFKRMKALYFPSVSPYFTSALVSGIGLGWKAGIAAEVLCSPVKSIGRNLLDAKIYINTADMFAWTLTVIILSLVLELIVAKLLKKLLGRYSYTEGNNES